MLLEALEAGLRLSGREFRERRKTSVQTRGTSVRVSLGDTMVLGSLQASKVMPRPERPNEGMLNISCHYGRCATPGLGTRLSRGDQVAHLVDSLLKGSSAIDMHSLCLLTGQLVWNLRISLHVVSDRGNVADAACVCALTVLGAFRKEQAEAEGAAPPLLHQPLLISHCVIPTPSKRLVLLADPSKEEEGAASTVITVGCNATGDVCLVNKCGGVAVPAHIISECICQSQKQVIEFYAAHGLAC